MLYIKNVMLMNIKVLLKQKLRILLVHLSQHKSDNIINHS